MSKSDSGDDTITADMGRKSTLMKMLKGRRQDDDDSSSHGGGSSYHGGQAFPGIAKSKSIKGGPQLSRMMTISRAIPEADEEKQSFYIHPLDKRYERWLNFLVVCSAFSAFFVPFSFAFAYDELYKAIIDWSLCGIFLFDWLLTFFVGYLDKDSYLLVTKKPLIARRFLLSWGVPDLLAALPYDAFVGRQTSEVTRWLSLLHLIRLRRFDGLFDRMEKDIRLNYFGVRMARLLLTVLWFDHFAACFMLYLAFTYPTQSQSKTWIGYIYQDPGFRDLPQRHQYVISLYWSTITIATVGYGDFHPVSIREMIFCIIYVLLNIVLMAYVLGNMTALIVRGSESVQKYRDHIRELTAFTHRNHLPRDLRRSMRYHTQLQFETEDLRQDVVNRYPRSIRMSVSRHLYSQLMNRAYIFQGCSSDFVSQLAGEVKVEWYMPHEEIIHMLDGPTHFYLLAAGKVELVEADHDGVEETLAELTDGTVFGEIGVLCNMPQPYTARSLELVEVLMIDRVLFNNIVQSFVQDGRQIVTNLLARARDANDVLGQKLSSEIIALIAQQDAELTMSLCYVASRGDLSHLQRLMSGGVSPNRADYDGRTPLHLCAGKGFDDCIRYLLRVGAEVNYKDNFGTTPLMEALRAKNVSSALLLYEGGGRVNLEEAGTSMCNAAIHGDLDLLRWYIQFGVDPDACDYDRRTALHIASAEGFLLVVKLLMEKGADPEMQDRWGHTALDEAQRWNHPRVLEEMEAGLKARAEAEQEGAEGKSPKELISMSPIRPSSPRRVAPTRLVSDNSPLVTMATGGRIPGGRPIHILDAGAAGEAGQLPAVGAAAAAVGAAKPGQRRRVTIKRYHPQSRDAYLSGGKVIRLPPTMELLLKKAGEEFGYNPTQVLNAGGAVIEDLSLIEDGDALFIVDESKPKEVQSLDKETELRQLSARLHALLGHPVAMAGSPWDHMHVG